MRLSPLLRTGLVVAAGACAACAPGSEPVGGEAPPAEVAPPRAAREPWLAPGTRSGLTRAGTLIAWRPLAGEVPKNRHFDLQLWIVRAGAPVIEAEVIVRATMPEHGHGMNVEPRALASADGSYRVRGMLLHMAGRWVLSVHVVEPGGSEQAEFELEVT